jgi:hypothetical protein
MILLFAVAAGLAAGFLRASLKGEPYQPNELKHTWLILVAALPQFLAIFLPATRERIPNPWIPFVLITSQLVLLVFVWLNRKNLSIWLLGAGLLLNLIVISLNGGWMPISPETLESLGAPESTWQIGSRHGYSKDIVLTKENTILWFLSDILTLPSWIPYRVAFSIGDVLIAAGVIGFLVQNNRSELKKKEIVQ